MRLKRLLAVGLSAAVLGPLTTIPAQADGLIDMPEPETWGACPLDNSAEPGKVIRTWHGGPYGPPENQLPPGDITLKCGYDRAGFRHIIERHGINEWQPLAAIENRNWRDLADMAITKSITNPDQVVPKGDGKWCLSSEVYLINKGTGEIAKVVRSVTIVSDQHEIITVYPKGIGCN